MTERLPFFDSALNKFFQPNRKRPRSIMGLTRMSRSPFFNGPLPQTIIIHTRCVNVGFLVFFSIGHAIRGRSGILGIQVEAFNVGRLYLALISSQSVALTAPPKATN